MNIRARTRCFLHHYEFLVSTLEGNAFEELLTSGRNLFVLEGAPNSTIRVGIPQAIVNEGELAITLEINAAVAYQICFTFVPGSVFGLTEPTVTLISRMQSFFGAKDLLKKTAHEFHGVDAQLLLFECLAGITQALGIAQIVGISAESQVCYQSSYEQHFRNTYDRFFQAHGFTQREDSIHELVLAKRGLAKTLGSSAHRRRAAKRRDFRAQVLDRAYLSWGSLLQANAPSTEYMGSGPALSDPLNKAATTPIGAKLTIASAFRSAVSRIANWRRRRIALTSGPSAGSSDFSAMIERPFELSDYISPTVTQCSEG